MTREEWEAKQKEGTRISGANGVREKLSFKKIRIKNAINQKHTGIPV